MNSQEPGLIEPVDSKGVDPSTVQKMPASEFIQEALKRGIHPRQIRTELQKVGIRWHYSFAGYSKEDDRRLQHQGNRERQRRLRQFCVCEKCNQPIIESDPLKDPRDRIVRLCDACLSEKWGGVL